MIDGVGGRVTLGADKAYDTADFVAELRARGVTPHVAQNNTNRRSAIDDRTTRHDGYEVSQRKRKRVEEIFGWDKVVGGIRKVKVRGLDRVGALFTLSLAAFNLVRIAQADLSSRMSTGSLSLEVSKISKTTRKRPILGETEVEKAYRVSDSCHLSRLNPRPVRQLQRVQGSRRSCADRRSAPSNRRAHVCR